MANELGEELRIRQTAEETLLESGVFKQAYTIKDKSLKKQVLGIDEPLLYIKKVVICKLLLY